MHYRRRRPVPFGKTQTHTRPATNICTKVSRYLGNVDLVAPPSASLFSSPPSPCHPYDPRDFPSFLISMVPSGERRSRSLDSSKWRKWEWPLSSVQGTLNEAPHPLDVLLDGFSRLFSQRAGAIEQLHRLRDSSEISLAMPPLPFIICVRPVIQHLVSSSISVRCHSKAQSSAGKKFAIG